MSEKIQLSISIDDLLKFDACFLDRRIKDISEFLGRIPENDEQIPLLTWAQVTPKTEDLIWALRCCWDRGGREVGVEVACRAAERVLHLTREEDREVCRAAIDATRAYLRKEVTQEDCRAETDAAYAAARDAYSAADYAAAYAAFAADYADDAAFADAAAAYAAAAADHPVERAKQRKDILSLIS